MTRSHRRGAEVVALELACALEERGHENEVHAIALGPDGRAVEGLPALVRSYHLGLRGYVLGAWRLRRRLAAAPADVVVAHGGTAALVVAVAGRRSGASLVWQRILGFPLEHWGPLRRRAWQLVARCFHGVVALTADMEHEMRRLGYDGPVWRIPNARDPVRFARVDRDEARAALRTALGVDPAVPVLAFVGHLVDQKQPEVALEVLSEVRRMGFPAHLVVAGDGPRRSSLEEQIERLGLADVVTLLGHRDDPEQVFGGADLTLITSRAEGIPGVAIEAQMTGCPVVSFDVGAVGDVVEDGVTGSIVPWPEPYLMAKHVVSLLESPARLRSMSDAAAARSEAFTTTAAASMYAAAFNQLDRRNHDLALARTGPGRFVIDLDALAAAAVPVEVDK